MKVIETALEGVYIVEPDVFGDVRGWFMETYSREKTPQIALDYVQDNHSFSAFKNTIRGIHFQRPPMEQAKLLRFVSGAATDYVVDLRRGSRTWLKWIEVELSAENKRQIFIPRGFGHAFITRVDNTEIVYKTDNFYSPAHETTIRWDDPEIGIDWRTNQPILSDKDAAAPSLKEVFG